MQQETQTSKPSAGAIVAIVGGIMLAIGSFLTWATVSVDTTALINKLAETLGLPPEQLQGLSTDSFSNSVSGWDGSDGKITLVVGVIIIIAAIVIFAKPRLRVAMGAVVIVAGLVGGGVAAYDASRVKDVANDAEAAAVAAAGSELEGSGLSVEDIFEGAFDVTAGVGLWVCIAGGVIALVGGVLALRERRDVSPAAMGAATSTTAAPAAAGTGFDAPPAPASTAVTEPPPVSEPPPAPVSPSAPCRTRDSAGDAAASSASHQHRGRHARRQRRSFQLTSRVRSVEFQVDTSGTRVLDLTERVEAFAADAGEDGLVHVFIPHATAGVALMETGSGSEADLEATLERLLPRDDRYQHRHGSVGHGGDHLLPVFVSPSLMIPAIGGGLALGTWQRVVLVDPNRENDVRSVRLSFLAG